jgi:hypothetical protein
VTLTNYQPFSIICDESRDRRREIVMLTALVLVCSFGATPDLATCNSDNAVYVMPVPGNFASPTTCFLHGQAYLAGTIVGRDLAPGDRVKVICVRRRASAEAQIEND